VVPSAALEKKVKIELSVDLVVLVVVAAKLEETKHFPMIVTAELVVTSPEVEVTHISCYQVPEMVKTTC
jgi:hypothetical protein